MTTSASGGQFLGSADMRAHVDYLRWFEGDLRSFRQQSANLALQLRQAAGDLDQATTGETSLDPIVGWLQDEHDRRTTYEVGVGGYADKLASTAATGTILAVAQEDLEGRLARAVTSVVIAQDEYDRRAWLENVPVLDSVERLVRNPVDEAYKVLEGARATERRLIDELRATSAMWLALLRREHGFVAMPEGLRGNQEGYKSWGPKPATMDVSLDGRGFRKSPWVGYADCDRQRRVPLHGASQVVQGSIGDCYFAAAIAAVASTDEGMSFLMGLVVDEGDGRYVVTFPGHESVTVDARVYVGTDGEPLSGHLAADGAFWFMLLEKAYAQLRGGYDDIGNGGDGSAVLAFLGLGGCQRDISSHTSDRAIGELLSKVWQGIPVTVSAETHSIYPSYEAGSFHELTVIGYDPGPPATVTVRNPWGDHGTPSPAGITQLPDGVLQMDVETFKHLFTKISYADHAPAPSYQSGMGTY